MKARSEPLFNKYAKLVPKNPIETELAMSKVHLSKNWKIPPRLKPGRRPDPRSDVKNTLGNETEPNGKESNGFEYASQEKRKIQNRDAQRAYRERRANRIDELEGTVETLQNMVKSWRKKCKATQEELLQSNKIIYNLRKENKQLKDNVEQLELKTASKALTKTPRRVKKTSISPAQSSDSNESNTCSNDSMLFLNPVLQNVIKNFKPMKAVTLKKRKISTLSQPSLFEDSATTPVSYNRSSSLSRSSEITVSPDGKCGFCSDSTTCVCKELEKEAQEVKLKDGCNGNIATCFRCSSKVETLEKLKGNCDVSRESGVICPSSPLITHSKKKRLKLNDASCIDKPPSVSSHKLVGHADESEEKKKDDDSLNIFEISDRSRPNTLSSESSPDSRDNSLAVSIVRAARDASGLIKNDEVTRTQIGKTCRGLEPGSCVQCRADPQSAIFRKTVCTRDKEQKLNGSQSNPVQRPSEVIPISDAYQRVRKYMKLKNMCEDQVGPSTLPVSLHKVASDLRISDREVERRSVDDAIKELDKNAME